MMVGGLARTVSRLVVVMAAVLLAVAGCATTKNSGGSGGGGGGNGDKVIARGHVAGGRITEAQLDEALDVLGMTRP